MCSTSSVNREMQMKTTIRYRITPTRMAKMRKTDNTKWWWEHEGTGTLIHCWRKCKVEQILWKTLCQFLMKLNIPLPTDPAILFLKQMKTCPQKDLYKNVHSSLNLMAPNQKPPKCPSANEWISKMWHICTREHCSAVKRQEQLIQRTTWMDLTDIVLSESSQIQRVHTVQLKFKHR